MDQQPCPFCPLCVDDKTLWNPIGYDFFGEIPAQIGGIRSCNDCAVTIRLTNTTDEIIAELVATGVDLDTLEHIEQPAEA